MFFTLWTSLSCFDNTNEVGCTGSFSFPSINGTCIGLCRGRTLNRLSRLPDDETNIWHFGLPQTWQRGRILWIISGSILSPTKLSWIHYTLMTAYIGQMALTKLSSSRLKCRSSSNLEDLCSGNGSRVNQWSSDKYMYLTN